MLPIQVRIDRAQRLIDMLERDAPLRAHRFSVLTPERQRFAEEYTAELAARAQEELEKASRAPVSVGSGRFRS